MTEDQIKECAKIYIDIVKRSLKVELDFNEESILKLDELADQLIKSSLSDQVSNHIDGVVALFASFLGEAIIKTLGGEWIKTTNGWGVQIGDATLNVFAKVKKRLLNGESDSISYYYESMKGMIANDFKDIG